jgi:proteasome beta subunit
MLSQYYLPGATTVGLACDAGVILASEKRVAYGYRVVSKRGQKVFKIADYLGAACAGLVADMQVLTRQISALTSLFELDNNRRMTVRSAAKTMSNLLFRRRFMPYLTQTIVGGIDQHGPSLYTLDPLGSVIRDNYATVGSGAEIAIGIIEEAYKDHLTLAEGKSLIIRAMKAAVARDAGSGDGIDLLLITEDGVTIESISA